MLEAAVQDADEPVRERAERLAGDGGSKSSLL